MFLALLLAEPKMFLILAELSTNFSVIFSTKLVGGRFAIKICVCF